VDSEFFEKTLNDVEFKKREFDQNKDKSDCAHETASTLDSPVSLEPFAGEKLRQRLGLDEGFGRSPRNGWVQPSDNEEDSISSEEEENSEEFALEEKNKQYGEYVAAIPTKDLTISGKRLKAVHEEPKERKHEDFTVSTTAEKKNLEEKRLKKLSEAVAETKKKKKATEEKKKSSKKEKKKVPIISSLSYDERTSSSSSDGEDLVEPWEQEKDSDSEEKEKKTVKKKSSKAKSDKRKTSYSSHWL